MTRACTHKTGAGRMSALGAKLKGPKGNPRWTWSKMTRSRRRWRNGFATHAFQRCEPKASPPEQAIFTRSGTIVRTTLS